MVGSVDYAELHCLSNFTFLRGASHPEELVERTAKLGYRALAITDECSLAGVVRAHVEAKQQNLPLIIGSEFCLDDGLRFVLLATDRESYGHLSALITRARRQAEKGSYRLTRDDLVESCPAGCLVLWLPADQADPADGPGRRQRTAQRGADHLAARELKAAVCPIENAHRALE